MILCHELELLIAHKICRESAGECVVRGKRYMGERMGGRRVCGAGKEIHGRANRREESVWDGERDTWESKWEGDTVSGRTACAGERVGVRGWG
jgi:hypothetical protein